MRNILILLLISIFWVSCQDTSKDVSKNKGLEKMEKEKSMKSEFKDLISVLNLQNMPSAQLKLTYHGSQTKSVGSVILVTQNLRLNMKAFESFDATELFYGNDYAGNRSIINVSSGEMYNILQTVSNLPHLTTDYTLTGNAELDAILSCTVVLIDKPENKEMKGASLVFNGRQARDVVNAIVSSFEEDNNVGRDAFNQSPLRLVVNPTVHRDSGKEEEPKEAEKMEDVKIRSAEPLYFASGEGDLDKVIKLIENGADVNGQIQEGFTALMFSSQEGHLEVVKKLIEYGADVNIENKNGNRAINFAYSSKKKNKKAIIDILKKAELIPEIKKVWQTFRLAMQSGDEEKIKSVVTERGFEWLTQGVEPDERKSTFRRWGEGWVKWEIRWVEITPEKVIAQIGSKPKQHGLEFIKTKDGWKLDKWLRAV